MTTQNFGDSRDRVPYPDIPPIIDSRETEYRGSGITSSVAIFGHPIHPVIVIFPVAFLSAVAGTDIGYWLTHDDFWARAGVWLLGSGILAGVAAAAIGIADYIRIPKVRQRAAGKAHMYINIAVLGLSAVNYFMRLGDVEAAIVPWGLLLSLIVATLLMVGGWFGGELSFRHKVGVVGSNETLAE